MTEVVAVDGKDAGILAAVLAETAWVTTRAGVWTLAAAVAPTALVAGEAGKAVPLGATIRTAAAEAADAGLVMAEGVSPAGRTRTAAAVRTVVAVGWGLTVVAACGATTDVVDRTAGPELAAETADTALVALTEAGADVGPETTKVGVLPGEEATGVPLAGGAATAPADFELTGSPTTAVARRLDKAGWAARSDREPAGKASMSRF